jgi:hypothetical protein
LRKYHQPLSVLDNEHVITDVVPAKQPAKPAANVSPNGSSRPKGGSRKKKGSKK